MSQRQPDSSESENSIGSLLWKVIAVILLLIWFIITYQGGG